jgi:hypothetical protein
MPPIIRRKELQGTAASRSTGPRADFVPKRGEVWFEWDTGDFGFGNGSTELKDLPAKNEGAKVFPITKFTANRNPGDCTAALNSAIDAAAGEGGGTIYLPPGPWTSEGEHIWPEGVYLQGAWAHPDGTSGTTLQLMTSGTHLFKIVPGTRGIGAKNITFLGGGLSNTDAVLIEGAYSLPIINLLFKKCIFNNFKYGCRINATDNEMQIQQLGFDKCSFGGNTAAAFYCNTNNTLIGFRGGTISVPDDGWAFYSASIGMFKVEGVEFVGIPGALAPSGGLPNTGMAEGVAYFAGHINVAEFSNCQDEKFRYYIRHVETTQPDAKISLNHNLIQSRISLEGRVRLSSNNNQYALSRVFRDIVTSGSYVVSENDEFAVTLDTGEAALTFPEPAYFLSPDTKLLVSKNIATGLDGFVQQWPQRFVRPNEYDGATAGRGWLQVLSESSLPCLEVGEADSSGKPVPGNTYFWYRDPATGHLVLFGGQPDYQGYRFDNGNLFVKDGLVAGASVQLTEVGSNVTINPDIANHFYLALTGNRTLVMGGMSADGKTRADGRLITIEIIQDGTGSRTLVLTTGSAGQFAFGTDITSITLTTTANKRDVLTVRYSKTMDRFLVMDFKKGF